MKSFARYLPFHFADDRKKTAFIRIANTLADLSLDTADGRIRIQPYCILLEGPPGCGKTSTAMKMASAFMKKLHGKFRTSDIVVLNETDEFQSEYRTNHKVVIFDDIGACKTNQSDTKNPWRKVIDFVNNIRKTSLNPHLELKGNVYIEPELVIMTTNLTGDLELAHWLVCPMAIFRRINCRLALKRYNLIDRYFHPVIKNEPGDTVYAPIAQNAARSGEFKNLDNELPLLCEEFVNHIDRQKKFVQEVNSKFDKSDKSSGPIMSFYKDMIAPYWPKKIPCPPELERQLPYYYRVWRYFCIEDDTRATCSMPTLRSPRESSKGLK
jgi:Cdc6-like AAA superfamily ATPase